MGRRLLAIAGIGMPVIEVAHTESVSEVGNALAMQSILVGSVEAGCIGRVVECAVCIPAEFGFGRRSW